VAQAGRAPVEVCSSVMHRLARPDSILVAEASGTGKLGPDRGSHPPLSQESTSSAPRRHHSKAFRALRTLPQERGGRFYQNVRALACSAGDD